MSDKDVTRPSRLPSRCAVIVLLISLLGVYLELEFAKRAQLQCEEAMYFQAANATSLAESWRISRSYTHPPLSFLLYHEWLRFGTSEWQLRLPSILLGMVATWITYLWIARLTDFRAALVGLVILTFSLPVLHVSAEMRNYTLLFLFVAGALWFDEHFRDSGRVSSLLGQAACLILAILSHYAAVWVIVVLGMVGTIRTLHWGVRSRITYAWAAVQVVLAGVCVWLYATHVREFVGSSTESELWDWWTLQNKFGQSWEGWLKFTLLSPCRFFGALFGPIWMPMLIAAVIGAVVIVRSQTTACLERALLIGSPFVLALLLHFARVYPFGSTRHSLWLVPFVALTVSGTAMPVLRRPSAACRLGVAVCCLTWVWLYPYRTFSKYARTLTPELMHRTVAKLKAAVPHDEPILVDDGTRYVLGYYLGRGPADTGHDIGLGFREFHLDGFRIVTIPAFSFYKYSLRDNWPSFSRSLGEQSTQPMWWLHMEMGIPEFNLKSAGRQLPPAKVHAQHAVGDNHLLRLQFREPNPQAAEGQSATQATLINASPSGG